MYEGLTSIGIVLNRGSVGNWLDSADDNVWRAIHAKQPEQKRLAEESLRGFLGPSYTPDQISEALSIITLRLLSTDDEDLRKRLQHDEIVQLIGEIKDDQEHILEMVLTEVYRLQDQSPYRRRRKRGRPTRFFVDPIPPSLTPRPEKMAEVVELLAQDTLGPVSVTSLRGAGGTGKTKLAIQVCQEPEVHRRYQGGVFFVVVGEEPNFDQIAGQLYTNLTGRTSPKAGNTLLLVADEFEATPEPCLLVLDDIWDRDHYERLTAGLPDWS